MKMRPIKKFALIAVAYLVVCAVLAIVWDVIWAPKLTFSASITAGVLTIIGGFLVAYWLIERDGISKELKRRKRVVSALRAFKNFLLPWLFHYANELSGEFGLYNKNRIYTGKYKDDIPRLEDIFGIRAWNKNGKLIRGTEADTSEEILKHPLSPQFLYGSLNYGLRMLDRIDRQIRIFPSLVEEVDPEVAEIVHLSDFIRSRITELQEWERKHDKNHVYTIDSAPSNLTIRANLGTVGSRALDVVIAIDRNIERLEAEL